MDSSHMYKTVIPADGDRTVAVWDARYLQRYPGNSARDALYMGIDFNELYAGLERLEVPCAGETTGLASLDFLDYIPTADYRRTTSFKIVENWVEAANTLINVTRDRDAAAKVQQVGPARKFYFVPRAVVGGELNSGFHAHENPMVPLSRGRSMLSSSNYTEYAGFYCASRYFPVSVPKNR